MAVNPQPTVGGDAETWGTKLNAYLSELEGLIGVGTSMILGQSGDVFIGWQEYDFFASHTLNREYAIPMIVPTGSSISGLVIHMQTSGSNTLRFGARANANGWPGTLLQDFGVLTATFSVNTLPVTWTPPAGLFWITVVQTSTASVGRNLRRPPLAVPRTTASLAGLADAFAPYQDGVSGALPSTFATRGGPLSTSHPLVGVILA